MKWLEAGTLISLVIAAIGFAFWLGGLERDYKIHKKSAKNFKGEPGAPGEGVPIGTWIPGAIVTRSVV